MSNTERKLLLEKLLNFEQPVQQTLAELQKFGWDSDAELIQIEPAHITNLLDGYLKGKFNATQIEEWANALECREDVAFLPVNRSVIRQAIVQLANPLLNEPITADLAKSLKIQLLQ